MGFFGRKAPKPSDAPSEKEDRIDLSAAIFFAEPLAFRSLELVTALREDFPGMTWGGGPEDDIMGDRPQVTDNVVIALFGIGPSLKPALAMTMPGHMTLPPLDLLRANRMTPEDVATITEAKSYVEVTVSAPKDDLSLRVEAGRRLAAIVSVLAGLPVARGVIWHPARRVVTAAKWQSFAADLRDGNLPTLATTLLLLGPDPDHPGTVSGQTVGLAAYIDAELEITRAPIEVQDAAMMFCTVGRMLTELGHRFADGHTMGTESAEPEDAPWTVRLHAADRHPTGIDHWTLIHPEAPFDHAAAFGSPPEVGRRRLWRSDMGWLARQLKRGRPN